MEPSFATPAPGVHAEPSKFHMFVSIAMLLAVITGVEIVLIFLPFPKWFIVASLVVLSLVKFMFVIFYFMHLRWDKLFCTILFFIGLVVASGTVWALLQIFGAEDSKPLTSTTAFLIGPPPIVQIV